MEAVSPHVISAVVCFVVNFDKFSMIQVKATIYRNGQVILRDITVSLSDGGDHIAGIVIVPPSQSLHPKDSYSIELPNLPERKMLVNEFHPTSNGQNRAVFALNKNFQLSDLETDDL